MRSAPGRGGVPAATSRTPYAAPVATDRTPVPADAGFRARYEAYRRRQGAELLALAPAAGVRALYRLAREAGVLGDDEVEGAGALDTLARFCADLLPLPDYETWKADARAHRRAHMEESAYRGPGPLETPVTVDLRTFRDPEGVEWSAGLELRRAVADWRGSVVFHAGAGSPGYRTGEVFREDDPGEVRRRFVELDRHTLRAFLRSVLP